MNLEFTDEERLALLRVIDAAVKESRWPLSPETEALERIAERLRENKAPSSQ
jgi:hypothetical protein